VGEIVGIWRAPKRRQPMQPLQSARVAEDGLAGCAHARPGKRSVLFVAAEDLEAIGLEPGVIRENFTVRGADVMSWPLGQRLAVGNAEFEIAMKCEGCELMEQIRPGLKADLVDRRGMLARVVRVGDVSVGDSVTLL
jgi:MOSC domain-containing protein YiiM